jgi:hypothetical protein
MSTSWQWFPETKTAICCYCGFSTVYADEFRGNIEHACDPTQHSPVPTAQGTHVGHSPRPESLSRVPLELFLACVHRGPELRQEPCEACGGGTRVKVFACEVHGECQLDDKVPRVKFCGNCTEFASPTT